MDEGKQNTSTRVPEEESPFLFRLKRTQGSTTFVQVDFSPVASTSLSSQQQTQAPRSPVLPTFNCDHLHYTPSFFFPLDQEKMEKNKENYLKLHQQRADEMSTEKEELLVARPSRSNSYCCICKAYFQDYLTHVNIPSHQNLLRSSPFQEDIQGLVNLLNPNPSSPLLAKQSRSKGIRKSNKGRKCKVVQINSGSSTWMNECGNKALMI